MFTKSISLFFFVILLSAPLFSQEDVKVIASDENKLIIEYTPKLLPTTNVEVDGIQFTSYRFDFCTLDPSIKKNEPFISARIINVGVPTELGNSFKVLSSNYYEVSGLVEPRVATPKLSDKNSKYNFDYTAYRNYTQSEDLLGLLSYGISRGVPVQSIKLNPIQFDVVNKKVRIYTKIVLSVSFGNEFNKSNKYTVDGFGLDGIINGSVAKNWGTKPQKALAKSVTSTSSVLATGRWFRFEAPTEGIYKITKSQLASYGIDAATVDPRTIKIYNNGGTLISEQLSDSQATDLIENPILVIGEENGKFDDEDYILFYGRGTNFYYFDTLALGVSRARNPYSNSNYYFITSGGSFGKRIESQSSLAAPAAFTATTSNAYAFREDDKINVAKLGREFLGDEFSSTTTARSYTTTLEGYSANTPVNYKVSFVNTGSTNSTLKLSETGQEVFTETVNGNGGYTYDLAIGEILSGTITPNLTNSKSLLVFNFTGGSSENYGYLDYFDISYTRDLKAVSDQFTFFSFKRNGTTEYQLSNLSSGVKVFDVSNIGAIKMITNPTLESGGNYSFIANESTSKISKYFVIGGTGYKTAVNATEVKNQNLKVATSGYEYIIIAPTDFLEPAERLRKFRATDANVPMTSIVVNLNEIFNEFGGGMRDVLAIREYIKYAYNNWSIKPKYVCLFGHGDYDYKNIEGYNINFIPPYEYDNGYSEVETIVNEDVFVCVDGTDYHPDLSIGRIPARSLAEANIYVDKVLAYEKSKDFGLYRNLITLVSDDQLTSTGVDGAPNTHQSEALANDIIPDSFEQNKIYEVNYPTVSTSYGRRKPEVNQAIVDAVNSGTLMLNYIGHSAPDIWSHERILVQSVNIPQFTNSRYFFLTAASCSFTHWDQPDMISGGETMLMKENSGAIGTMAAARIVYSGQNDVLNRYFYYYLFSTGRDIDNNLFPVGKAMYSLKQSLFYTNDCSFHILGDPALRLQVPKGLGVIDSINGQVPTATTQLKALSSVTLKGSVRNSDNSINSGFSGEGILTVLDSKYKIPLPEVSSYDSMSVAGGIIFKGRITVTNGKFSTNFIVPKDISYENKSGKIVFYFYNSSTDGLGYTNSILVGGTDSTITNDGKGPEIEVSFDNPNSGESYLVQPKSTLYIKLKDETGLNTTGSGVGHKIEGVLNNDQSNPLDFNKYFTGDLDSGGKTGMVTYKFTGLNEGSYTLAIKAWDVFNNLSTRESHFIVTNNTSFDVDMVMNYPNPTPGATTFTFQQNAGDPVDVKIVIYTISGRKIKEIEKNWITEKFVTVEWDGKDNDGDYLANGVYLYKLLAKQSTTGASKSVVGKLAIMR